MLGPGDVLELHFWGVENFRLRVIVDLEGRAFVAKVGYLSLKGRTLAEAQQMLRASVARYFPKLDFGVTLPSLELSWCRSWTTWLARTSACQGPPPGFLGHRQGRRVRPPCVAAANRDPAARRHGSYAELLLYSITGDVKNNPYVLDEDVIRVPFETLVATIRGAVNRPGSYELIGKGDLAELLELSGGLAPSVTRELPVTVVRREPEEKLKRLAFAFGASGEIPSVPMQSEDAVWIPAFSELQQSVTIVGALAGVAVAATDTKGAAGTGAGRGTVASDEAAATRRLAFAQGDTVRSVLERVGGPGPLADLKGSYIVRGSQTIPVDLYALVMLRDFKADKPIELGDKLVLPFKRQNILIEGAVFKPGPYPYNPTYGVDQYLALAGGLNRFAQSVDEVYLVTPTGETKAYSSDLKVDPGAATRRARAKLLSQRGRRPHPGGRRAAAQCGDHLPHLAQVTMDRPYTLNLSFLRRREVQVRIVAATLVFAIAGFLYGTFATKMYRSTLTLVSAGPQKQGMSSLLGSQLGGLAASLNLGGGADAARIAAVLQSTSVTDAVIEKLDLKKRYDQRVQELARNAFWGRCSVKILSKPNLVQSHVRTGTRSSRDRCWFAWRNTGTSPSGE